jgi:Zn-dependent M28 family amino/carboxypeptidase
MPSVPASAQDTARLIASLKAIAESSDSAARREAIVAQLKAVGVEPRLETFGGGRNAGSNIVVSFGKGAKTLLLGAHYDRVEVGQGAVDNGASCAALIEIIAAIKALPLQQLTLHVVFFDREENGLQGSRAFFAARPRVDYAINMDVFAYGDSIFATRSHADGLLVRWLQLAGKEVGLPVRDVPRERYPASDHLTMMNAKIETLGVALVDRSDIDGILSLSGGVKTGAPPRVLTIIHTANDTLAEVRPEQMTRGITLVEQLIRIVDRAE